MIPHFIQPVARGAGLALLLLTVAACNTTAPTGKATPVNREVVGKDAGIARMYAPVQDGERLVPGFDAARMQRKYVRQIVDYPSSHPTGTIIVDPHNRFVYLTMEQGKAMRYGVGVAKAGLEFEGSAKIARKAQWPRWTPTPNMIQREPERYGPLAQGMEPGLKNPLGARALYLFKDGRDTLYRIHGTNEPWSIGKAVSSGCIRMLNQDIMDLYNRVPQGSKVVVLGADSAESV